MLYVPAICSSVWTLGPGFNSFTGDPTYDTANIRTQINEKIPQLGTYNTFEGIILWDFPDKFDRLYQAL